MSKNSNPLQSNWTHSILCLKSHYSICKRPSRSHCSAKKRHWASYPNTQYSVLTFPPSFCFSATFPKHLYSAVQAIWRRESLLLAVRHQVQVPGRVGIAGQGANSLHERGVRCTNCVIEQSKVKQSRTKQKQPKFPKIFQLALFFSFVDHF